MKLLNEKVKLLFVSLYSSLLFASCATIFHGVNPNQSITITSVPDKADVIIAGKVVGQTPLNYKMKNRKTKFVQISKQNYQDHYTKIETKLSPGWTALSVIGGAFPGLLIPTAIDFATGSVRTIKTEKIECELKPIGKGKDSKTDKNNSKGSSSYDQVDQIYNPRVRVRTGTREFLLGYKSCVKIITKGGIKIGSNIVQIEKDYLVLAKNNTKVYYNDIAKIRMFPIRRWYPIVTSYTVISPIIWFVSSKMASTSSNDCKKQIKQIDVINKYTTFGYGKDGCK
jgi:hypothetical protein